MNRDEIINKYDKSEFMNFLKTDNNGKVLELLNDEGLSILNDSPLKQDRINYILCHSNYKNELFQNKKFLHIFLDTNIDYYYAYLNNLSDETYSTILEECQKQNLSPQTIIDIFKYTSIKFQEQNIKRFFNNEELIYILFQSAEPKTLQVVIDNYDIDLTSHNINIENFFSKCKDFILNARKDSNSRNETKEGIKIPPHMITEKLLEKMWNKYDIFELRQIVNDIEYCMDPTVINKYIKYKEEQVINHSRKELLPPFNEIYDFLKRLDQEKKNDEESSDLEKNHENRITYYKLLTNIKNDTIRIKMKQAFQKGELNEAFNCLKEQSNRKLSNCIIDYHFEENYHNIMLDINELLRFYYDGNIVLPSERVDLYYNISNIDYLEINEKIELHNLLKKFNMIEIFYDDMRLARDIVYDSIKEYSLSSSMLEKYRDEKLSKEYGVDVYLMDGEPFFGLVKSGGHIRNYLPTGYSYSLIGDGCLAVFGDIENNNTYLYNSEDLNPEQIVHVFPFDSYSCYHPFEYSTSATSRVQTLMMPDELVKSSYSYNELVILEKGRKATNIDDKIPELKKLALYCLDEIQKGTVEQAKKEGVGIFLVKSNQYKNDNSKNNTFNRIDNPFEYDYFDGKHDIEKFERRR